MRRWRRRLRHLRRRLKYGRHASTTRRVVLYGAGLLFGLGAVWLIVTGLLAKQQLSRLESRISEVKTLVSQGRISDARVAARDIPNMARRAHHLTTGPAWWISAHVPYLGEPLDVARGTTVATERIGAEAVPQLLRVATLIDPNALRASGNTIKIGPLATASPQLDRAAATIDAAAANLNGLSSDTWLGSVNTGRAKLAAQVASIKGYVDAAARVSKALPDMLGQDRPQRYFIGLQNEAELRGTGGLPGAFAIAVIRNGTITFTHFESDATLEPPGKDHAIPTGLDFGTDYNSLYGPSLPTSTFVDSNVSPNFPYAAQIWAAMWTKVSGEPVDGVVALDPTALSYFLAATGAAALPDGTVLSATNVVSLTQRDNYVLYPDNAQRKQFLVSVLRAAARRITSGAGAPLNLVKAASLSSSQKRLIAWSRDPKIEKILEQTDYAAAIPTGDRPFSAVILNNAAAGKLDFYLVRTMSYTRTGCGPRRDVLVTITLQNNAPASGLPLYVVGRADHPPPGAKPGDNHELLDYYASANTKLQSVTLNGQPSTAGVETALGHTVLRMDLELPRGTTQTIVLHLDEPAGKGAPLIWKQPGVTPLQVSARNQTCGG
jgi:hypothetical protein